MPAWRAFPLQMSRSEPGVAEVSPGLVALIGGYGASDPLATAELLDLATTATCALPPLPEPRVGATALTLEDGSLLVVGGRTMGSLPTPTRSLRLSKPTCGAGQYVASSTELGKRWDHSAIPLLDGRVLVFGGHVDGQGGPTASTFVYDPESDVWSELSPMKLARVHHTATLLADGRVLVTGGYATKGEGVATAITEIWSPQSEAWSAAGTMSAPRAYHAAAREAGGAVVVAGGWSSGSAGALATAERFDPVAGTWSNAPGLAAARVGARAVSWAGDSVVVLGGLDGVFLSSVELSRAGAPFTALPPMSVARRDPSVHTLGDGSVLVVGGVTAAGPTKTVELLRRLPRGESCSMSTECSTGACVDGVCCETACAEACSACTDAKRGDALGDGRCGPVTAGRDPDDECASDASASCGHTGLCDGAGSCAYQGPTVSCGAATCDGSRRITHACDAAGSCASSAALCDGGLACRGDACLTSCRDDSECQSTHRCADARCVPRAFSRVCDASGTATVDPSGASESCGAYRCADGACLTQCRTALDCAEGTRCAASGQCVVAQSTPREEPGGCATHAPPPGAAPAVWVSLVIVALVQRFVRRW